MLSIGRLALPFSLSNSNSTSLLLTKNIHNYTIPYVSLLSPNKTHNKTTHLSLVLNPFSTNPLFTFHKTNNRLYVVSARKKPRKGGATGLMEMDGSDEDEDDGFVVDDDDEDDEEEDEGMFLPFGKMRKWLENKPRGFGEGKVYDTSVEEKLLEELEQSKEAQAVNIDKLKSNPVKPGSKKDNNKATEVLPSGIRVRLTNLPKKKNIHRDLKSAFEEVAGIINIVPAVSGNKKTKDPICKGFAFVDFKTEEGATRFVHLFARQSIAFGKIQKQIKCEMMNSHSPNSVDEQAPAYTYIVPEPTLPDLEEDPTNSEMDDSSLDLWAETASDASDDPDDEFDTAKLEDIRKNLESVSISVQNGDDSMESVTKLQTNSISSNREERIRAIDKKLLAKGKVEKVRKLEVPVSAKSVSVQKGGDSMESATKFQTNSISSNPLERIRALEKRLLARGQVEKVRKLGVPGSAKRKNLESVSGSVQNGGDSMEPTSKFQTKSNRQERIRALEKKLLAKGKVEKVPKLEVPGSAKRLKMREKAVLTGVFSKYGVKAASTSKEES